MHTKTQPAKAKLEDFTQHPDVLKAMAELEEHFLRKKKVVSDIVDEDGNQYVNLVQEGGGVLGVALVGYTYVLEKMKIRFMRLAGTSAGAINTSLLTCIGKKEDEKSGQILDYLVNTNLFSFVDGHPFAKKVIGLFITNKGVLKRSIQWIRRLFAALAVLLAVDVVSFGLQHKIPVFAAVAKISFVCTGFLLLLCGGVVVYGRYMLRRFRSRGYGINPGRKFHDWMKKIMEENGVATLEQLKNKAGSVPHGLSNRLSANVDDIRDLNPDITLITSDIASQNKIELSKMCDLFVSQTGTGCALHPADFVRASMSIPIFFESFTIDGINAGNEAIQKAWQTHFSMGPDAIPATARLVDGGVLSNFPINIFYNPRREVPRLPTFGIRLNDADPGKPALESMGLGAFAGKLFNTVRYHYDKDFLLKNNVYKKGIGEIDVHEFNWLNFGMPVEDQVALFVRGVQTAKAFLIGDDGQGGFNWEEYKAERIQVFRSLSPTAASENAAGAKPVSPTEPHSFTPIPGNI